jgi:DnaJ-class molecular chaperone
VPSADDFDRLAALAALGLAEGASPQEILSAYRRLARSSHPDTAEGAAANSDFARVNAAYRYLTTTTEQAASESSTAEAASQGGGPPAPAADWDEQYRWPDEAQVVAGPVIIRPLPPEAR